MQWIFEIPCRLPGLNEIINEARKNKFSGSSHKKKWTTMCAQVALAAKIGRIAFPAVICVAWYEPDRRRDLDNIAAGIKFILDGLVEAGVLPNDSRTWIKGITHKFPEPDGEGKVVVCLTELR